MKHLLVATALVCVVLPGLAQQETSTRAARNNGERAYMRAGCYACHGTVGHGGAATPLTPNTLPLEAFTIWVRTGTPGWSTSRGMPAFSTAIVTDEELADMRAFLVGLPKPPAVEDVDLLND